VEFQVLRRRQGRSIRQIVREMELSRKTVRRHFREQRKVSMGRVQRGLASLIRIKTICMSASHRRYRTGFPATVLLREIRVAGYGGGIGQLKVYLQAFKVVRVVPADVQQFAVPLPGTFNSKQT
jgi:hypothetical protein